MTTIERLSIYVPADVKDWYKQEADRNGVRMSNFISLLLSSHKDSIEAQRTLEFIRRQAIEMSQEDFKNSYAIANAIAEICKKDLPAE